MPLFDFHCRACGAAFETLVRPGSTPACPSCQSVDLERQVSTFAVSSSERRSASASKAREKAAAVGRRDNAIKAAEAEEHRHDDH